MSFSTSVFHVLRLLGLLLVFFCGVSIDHAQADTITTFTASGTFNSGSLLTGTITIDTTVGSVQSLNLDVSAPDSLTFNVFTGGYSNFPGNGDYSIYAQTSGGGTYPYLVLVLGTSSLVDFHGGAFGSNSYSVPGNYHSGIGLSASLGDNLANGTLTPVPEAPSLATACGGSLLVIRGLVRRQKLGMAATS